jgi:Ca2+-dependent lipid-binding protein
VGLAQVVYKTLAPQWQQTLEFVDDHSPLVLHVKDYNAIFPTSSIGHCDVEYEHLHSNQTIDRWIPLQGVRKGEIHIQLTRRVAEKQTEVVDVPELQKSIDSPMKNIRLQQTTGKV